ncbi:hypothetical protein [Enterococcus wangshanyuanii]|uniref:Uncharacterized protein n=1 Tax=Enterococcus wangshanyuanii TaxID=2005703 RepID=A0ABQ1PGJ2_9ENTE|nr:hypothetical protein [Enterococcus wangshanyuanii]GGC96775.1 hypothetical protein GCM10011573_27930 [Enterococcus wangshanyuanii]
MLYMIYGGIIFATHYWLKENQWLLQKRLRHVIFVTLLTIGAAVIISTWLGSLIPVIVMTLVTATILQSKYLSQLAVRKIKK